MRKKVKLFEISKFSSGGDAPKDYSNSYSDVYRYPIFGNSLDKEGLYGYAKQYSNKAPAITISSRGSNCGVAFLREKSYLGIVRLISLEPNEDIIDIKYLYYLLSILNLKSTGSGQPQITVPQLQEVTISIETDKNVQRKIGNILYKIDSQIKNNNQMVQKLQYFKPILNFFMIGGIQYA